MTISAADLHIFFFPMLTPGHLIPMVDLAVLISSRIARSTIVTTPANAELLRHTLAAAENSNIHLLTVPFASDNTALPENLTAHPNPDITPAYFASLCQIEPHLDQLILAHRPDCIVSDFFFPWTTKLAKRYSIPRIAFHGSGYFYSVIVRTILSTRIHESVSGEDEFFVVPGIPHSIKLTRSQLSHFITSPPEFMSEISASIAESYGTVMNTFYEIEPGYAQSVKAVGSRSWHVGPFFLCRLCSSGFLRSRGCSTADTGVFSWLDRWKAGTVLYVCFGSLPRFTATQFREIREGLAATNRPFVWVMRDEQATEGISVTSGEEDGYVIKGWAPQLAILMHEAVGGFMTHCGWNSCLEGMVAGVPMVTWPLFADQPVNEKLLVDVLDLGVRVGSMVNSVREEERTVVAAEKVTAAVEAVMGGGVEGEERRQRAKKMKELAATAVAPGGSSEVELGRMVEELALNSSRMKEAVNSK